MFYGATLVESHWARALTLRQVLSKCVEGKFTGFIQYVAGDFRAIIGLNSGNIVTCRVVKEVHLMLTSVFAETRRRTIIDGVEACEEITRYLDDRSGLVEVYSTDRNTLLANLLIVPQARVESSTTLATLLKTGVGYAVTKVEQPVAQPPQPVTPPPALAPPTLKPPLEVAAPVPAKQPTPLEISAPPAPTVKPPSVLEVETFEKMVVDECIDPLMLFNVLRTSKLVESASALELKELVERARSVVDQTKPSLVYVGGTLDDSNIKILINIQAKSMYIGIEGKEATTCGKDALKSVQGKKIANVRIWIVK